MKKLFLMLAAGMMAASVNAQNTAITSNKFGDNWYMGINAGLATPQQKFGDYGFFKGFAPKVGVRVGKNLTTVFGLAADADLYFLSKTDSKSMMGSKTFINNMNVDLLGTFNLSNLFAGYKGEPRTVEVIGLAGLGWTHAFGYSKSNAVNAKAAIDLAFNLGEAKAWQIYIEPSLIYGLEHYGHSNVLTAGNDFKFDSRAALFQLSAGFNYKFGNSNGTHNFAVAQLRDQAEIDGLNAKINELRADNQAKDSKIAADGRTIQDLKAQLAACQARPTAAAVVAAPAETVLQPIVIFRQGKSTIDPAQYASIEMIAKYMKNHPEAKVKVQGYASPEGKAEFNQKLSEKRAEVVKNALIKKYKIAADRVTVEGLGATDKLSQENDFNRVAMFVDTTK